MSDAEDTVTQAEAEQAAELARIVSDYSWRIHTLYKIIDETGEKIVFQPNWAQINLFDNLHYFNIILKARQLGFSTMICIHGLDRCVFYEHQSFGIVAQGEKEAQKLLDKCRFAYNNLPEWIRQLVPIVKDNTETIEFANGSKIEAGVSLRSGTNQILLVSEFGKTSAQFPAKAKEVKTGALNTVHIGQQVFVESTAEGQGGEYYDLCKLARKLEDEARELTSLQPKFHFYPWFQNPNYVLTTEQAERAIIDEEYKQYFRELQKEHFIMLSLEQQAWYAQKADVMGEDMFREFPSTPDEAFAASVSGSIYGRQMRLLRKAKRITSVPWEPSALVHTFWDLGSYNYMSIWFFQQIGLQWRMIKYFQNTGADLSIYVDFLRETEYSFGKHHLPHDGRRKYLQETGGNKSVETMLKNLGLRNIKIVERTNDVRRDIETVCKPALMKCYIDAENCSEGIKCLDNYRKARNKDGIWLEDPQHDEFSDGADGFRTFALGYKPEVLTGTADFRLGSGQAAL